jgi:hypothetical protein
MAHYFFEVQDGHRLTDPSGIECRTEEEAIKQAKVIAAQIAADVPASANRRVAVIDDRGREIASLTIGDNQRAS